MAGSNSTTRSTTSRPETGHHEVGQNDIGMLAKNDVETFFGVLRGIDAEAVTCEGGRKEFKAARVVIDDDEFWALFIRWQFIQLCQSV